MKMIIQSLQFIQNVYLAAQSEERGYVFDQLTAKVDKVDWIVLEGRRV